VYGTCYSSTECTNKGGSADGNCAAGFGVCCTFTVSTCGSTISNNCSYIENPTYPTTYSTAGSCAYSVTPISSDICQLRLDLDNFDITDNVVGGACVDKFDVEVGSSRKYYTLCGTNTGYHIYLETGRDTSAQTLTFTIATGGTWRIKVSQIECYATYKAPSDCYQFYTGVSGEIKSFNYPVVMLDDQIYSICVRQETGFCGIEWSAAATTTDSFDLTSDQTTGQVFNDATGNSQAYLTIPGTVNTNYGGIVLTDDANAIAASKETVGSAIRATGQLFHVQVNTNGANAATATIAITGFHLVWNQLPCSNTFNIRA